jgi:superfamily II DNA or RNA helicase
MDVADIEFSGGTYQVQVVDGDEEYWPFLQFDSSGEVQDAFCGCASVEGGGCAHLAAALLRVLGREGVPLHLRFQASLWNALCELYCARQGDDASILQKDEDGSYRLWAPSHKHLFSVKGGERLETLIERRVRETEETSLKFSGLSQEELARWREGNPSEQLRYELSFWSDLAKWLFLLQDSGASYKIEFEGEGLPSLIKAKFDELEVEFYLSEANLPEIVPTLATVKAPLRVHYLEEEMIDEIVYDRKKGAFEVCLGLEGMPAEGKPQGIAIDGWTFVPGDGFYSTSRHELLTERRIGPEQLGKVLTEHTEVIARHLKGERVHSEPIPLRYALHFDRHWRLHIRSYLFRPGDLQEGESRLFGRWAYLEEDGFHPVEEPLFEQAEVVVEDVSSFIHANRVWLGEQEGFGTHLTPIESQLRCRMQGDTLCFDAGVEAGGAGHDFGDWIYVAGQGFYAKSRARGRSPVRAGVRVAAAQIPMFIRVNREDLELLEGFFTTRQPVIKGALSLKLKGQDQLLIGSTYEVYPEYEDLQFFPPYVYIPEEGFREIPHELRVPERFSEPQVLKGDELTLFLAYELDELRPLVADLDRGLEKPTGLRLIARHASLKRGVIELEMEYRSSHGRVEVTDLWQSLEKNRRFVFSKAGLIDLYDNRFGWLRQIPPQRVNRAGYLLRLSALEFIRLMALEPLEAPGSEEAQRVIDQFGTLDTPTEPDLSGLQSMLRPYQKTGLDWLWFLHSYGLSGLLCDDMGLGKTHQAMALIAAVQKSFSNLPLEERPQFLVVCPTSVIYHWEEKLAAHLPGLRVLTFHGPQRELAQFAKADLLLTSYGIARTEKKRLSAFNFEVAVFDEVQVAKNHTSQTHAALASFKARTSIGLTGTPIENSLRELKSLFDLVLPGYLPSDAAFRQGFILPIEKDGDQAKRRLLQRVVKPFLLRRKKEQVLTELPEKTEEKMHCDLLPDQRALYNDVLRRNRDELLRQLDESRNYVHIFAILTHLKQICDHPAVYLKEPYKEHDSGKWQLFLELLSQARESRQKVVVFSQYLGMLDIIEQHLTASGIGYAAIRGETVKRGEELQRFAKDPTCEVFVGSLQAAGLGIDLTAASVVIHYDRWWNAARENQATDRVHRLGQTRGVQVFKLLTLGTLEERIDQMITEKGQLMEEVVGTSEQGQMRRFTREEIEQLLALVE